MSNLNPTYDDLSYFSKREILRNFYKTDLKAKEIIYNIISSINNKTNIKSEYLEKLLVDGYIAFERIYDADDNTKCIGVKELEPLSILPSYNYPAKKKIWIINFLDDVTKRVVEHDQIIYLSYKDEDGLKSLSLTEFYYKKYELISSIFYKIIERKIIHKFKIDDVDFLKCK
jgi:hypothetical protein